MIVRIAFRTGVLVDAVAQQLAPSNQDSEEQQSWSTVVAGMSETAVEATLDDFHRSKVRLTTRHVSIRHLTGTGNPKFKPSVHQCHQHYISHHQRATLDTQSSLCRIRLFEEEQDNTIAGPWTVPRISPL